MTIGLQSDLQIYNALFNGAMYESVAQNLDALNANSAGTILLGNEFLKGNYAQTSFWKALTTPVTRRDMASVSAVTDKAASQAEVVSVKILKKFGPFAHAIGALKQVGTTPAAWFEMMGGQYGKTKTEEQLNMAFNALVAALEAQTAIVYDATGTSATSLTHGNLVEGMALFGDRSSSIKAWVMHSKPYFDLVGNAISDKITNVADVVIYGGGPGTFNKPVIVSDSSYLIDSSTSTSEYYVLGLTEGAAQLTQSAEDTIANVDEVTGLEQLAVRSQAEFAYNLSIKGFEWDSDIGSSNPTAATVGTGSNWDKVVTSDKDLAGIMIKVL